MSLQEKLHAEVESYNNLVETLQKMDEERLRRLGRIGVLQELIAGEQGAEEADNAGEPEVD